MSRFHEAIGVVALWPSAMGAQGQGSLSIHDLVRPLLAQPEVALATTNSDSLGSIPIYQFIAPMLMAQMEPSQEPREPVRRVAPRIGRDIVVFVDQERITFPDMEPVEENGRVMVPLRGVFEKLGANVRYESGAQTVHIDRGETQIRLRVGEDFALRNEVTVAMGARAVMLNGRVMVPLRFLAETLDANVEWQGSDRTVRINRRAVIPAPSTQNNPPPQGW